MAYTKKRMDTTACHSNSESGQIYRTTGMWFCVGTITSSVDSNKMRGIYATTRNSWITSWNARMHNKFPKELLEDETAWYIPHHGIYNSNKPGKIRVVFDCSAKYQGTSLNDNLLQGPDLTNGLIGVLARFRKETIAIMCNIEKTRRVPVQRAAAVERDEIPYP